MRAKYVYYGSSNRKIKYRFWQVIAKYEGKLDLARIDDKSLGCTAPANKCRPANPAEVDAINYFLKNK